MACIRIPTCHNWPPLRFRMCRRGGSSKMFQGGGMFGGPGGGGGSGGPAMARLRGAIDADDDDILGKVYDSRVFKRIPRFMSWVKWQIVFGATGTLIRSLTTIIIPIVVQKATDDYMIHQNFNGLTLISLIYVGISLLMW